MAGRALLIGCLAWGAAALAQPAADRLAPLPTERPRVATAPAIADAIRGRDARWVFHNDSDVAIMAIRLKPDGAAEFGANLLRGPIAPGASLGLPRAGGACNHSIDIRFANGGRQRLARNLCDQPDVRIAEAAIPITTAMRPPPPAPAPVPAPAPMPQPAPQPVTEPATRPAAARVYCPLLEEDVPPIVCERATAVDRGVAGIRARPDMLLDEVQVVRLVVSRAGNAPAVADELGGEGAVLRQFGLATGRHMEAQLTADGGLRITPAGWVRRDLGAGDLEDWEWQVKAVAQGRHQVLLRTRVMKEQEDGSFIPRPGRESEPQYVEVRITRAQAIDEQLGLFTRWTKALAAPAESLTNLLTLLGTLVAAAGALWAAIRAFGRKPKDDSSD